MVQNTSLEGLAIDQLLGTPGRRDLPSRLYGGSEFDYRRAQYSGDIELSPDVKKMIEGRKAGNVVTERTGVPPGDLQNSIISAKNRVTRLLLDQSRKAPEVRDITRALLSTFDGKKTYGEAINAIQAGRKVNALKAYEIERQAGRDKAADEEARLRREEVRESKKATTEYRRQTLEHKRKILDFNKQKRSEDVERRARRDIAADAAQDRTAELAETREARITKQEKLDNEWREIRAAKLDARYLTEQEYKEKVDRLERDHKANLFKFKTDQAKLKEEQFNKKLAQNASQYNKTHDLKVKTYNQKEKNQNQLDEARRLQRVHERNVFEWRKTRANISDDQWKLRREDDQAKFKWRVKSGELRSMRPLGPYVDNAGRYLGEGIFNQGEFYLRPSGGGQMIPLPINAQRRTPTALARSTLTGQQFIKLHERINFNEQSITALVDYWKKVKDSSQGWRLLASQFVGEFNTVFGNRLTSQQLTDMTQSGRLQGLLGRFRKEVVGGGVLTEQDAERVISRLGNDVSALRSPEVVADAIRSIMKQKVDTYNNVDRKAWNMQVSQGYGQFNYVPRAPIKVDYDDLFGGILTRAPTEEAIKLLLEDPKRYERYFNKHYGNKANPTPAKQYLK